jgi:phosphoglycerate dehydrogenase-like enzyme
VNVLVAVFSPAPAWTMPRRFIDVLRRDFPQHAFHDAWDENTLRAFLPEADVAFSAAIDRAAFASRPRLKWVQSPATGVGGMLGPELIASPIVVSSARGVRARAIAEHVIGMTIALARQLPLVLRRQVEHAWALDEIESSGTVLTLQGRRMAIVGLGAIGLEASRIAAALGMRVSAIRRRIDLPVPPSVEETLPPERLHELLARTDVIVLSAPLTAETTRLIDQAALQHVKRGAFLINVGRGKLVDDDAVVQALRDGRLGGAALDVFTKEPLDRSSAYWDLPNVIVTPHIAGAMEDYWTPLVELFSENLRRFERNEPLLNVVDKAAGY